MTSVGPGSLIADVGPHIGELGAQFYFAEATLAVGREHGLDPYRFYYLGRGGVLGDVEAAVVGSAFGYFHPALVERMWTSARSRTSLGPREAARLYLRCCHDHGRRYLADVAELAGFCAAAAAVNDAADRAGLALYAGWAAEPLAEDLPARAMQLAAVLREWRGSAHLLALVATPGIDPVTAHGVRRPEAWQFFGHGADDLPVATDERRSALRHAELLTDQLVRPAFDVLDEAGAAAMLAGLEAMEKSLPPPAAPPR